MHVRGQIREAVRAILVAVDGLDSENVFIDSDEMLSAANLPAACVWMGDEDIEHETLGGTTGASLQRQMLMNVDILYKARRDALLEAEEIAAKIEAAVAVSAALEDLARSWFPQAITINRDSEGSVSTVRMRLVWLVTYSTNERDPTVAIS